MNSRGEKISKALKGKPKSEIHKQHLKDAHKKRTYYNTTGLKLGKGELAGNWKGGVSKNKDYFLKKGREWTKKNRDWKCRLNAERRARKLNAIGGHTLNDWQNLKAQYDWTCPCCKRREPEIVLTEDHIIPLVKGGSDNIENIQPLCGSCNSKKHTNIIKYG